MPPRKQTPKKATGDLHLWLALDPETRRVLVQDHEFQDGDFPPGLRGLDWPRRELDVPRAQFDLLLQGEVKSEDQDRLHRDWWDKARPEGAPMWPGLPGDAP